MNAIEKIVREWEREFCQCDERRCDIHYVPKPLISRGADQETATDILAARLKALDKSE